MVRSNIEFFADPDEALRYNTKVMATIQTVIPGWGTYHNDITNIH